MHAFSRYMHAIFPPRSAVHASLPGNEPMEVAPLQDLMREILENPALSLIVVLAVVGIMQCLLLLANIIVLRQVRRQIWAMRNLRQAWRDSTESVHIEVLQMLLRLLEQGRLATSPEPAEPAARRASRNDVQPLAPLAREMSSAR